MEKQTTKSLITEKSGVLEELIKSRDKKKALGIWGSALGQGMFLCVVKDIWSDEDEQDYMIILEQNEILVPGLNTHVIYLGEIIGVYTF